MASFCEGKQSWPELVGMDAKIAVATIEKENPLVNAIIAKPYDFITFDFRCDQVWVRVDCEGIVRVVPTVGYD
ncbi:hypothetical protein CDL12_18713 [Handroanthus impetiginosus]|uniref:Uncharacterized protein n=1 Tax=Handroanthus impetiginosus TaxID=429701 RepID=A0A2G9GTV0_9LAMI|nr:hypothetical protein CDL12_18713 [Handroanthus impetiginosus]